METSGENLEVDTRPQRSSESFMLGFQLFRINVFISAFVSHHQQDSLVINQIADVDKTILFQKVVLPFPRGPCNFIQFRLANFII